MIVMEDTPCCWICQEEGPGDSGQPLRRTWVGLRIIFIFRVLLNTYANQKSLNNWDGRGVDESRYIGKLDL